jgi:hypothetical protein
MEDAGVDKDNTTSDVFERGREDDSGAGVNTVRGTRSSRICACSTCCQQRFSHCACAAI